MKYIGIALVLSISPFISSMERPPHWPQSKQANKQLEFDRKETTCAICTDNMIPGEEYSCTPCQHAFHYECFKPFSKSQTKNRCPLCRAPLSDKLLVTMHAKPSGTIMKNEGATTNANTNQEVGFFRKMMHRINGSETDLSSKNSQLQESLDLALFQCRQLTEVRSRLSAQNAQLTARNIELQRSNNRQANTVRQQIENHDALRRRIVCVTAAGSGICSGILASRYFKSNPKFAGLMTAIGVMAASYKAGSLYCDDLLRQDQNNNNS